MDPYQLFVVFDVVDRLRGEDDVIAGAALLRKLVLQIGPIAGKESEASVGLALVGKVEQHVGHRDVLDHLPVVVLEDNKASTS